MILFPIEDMIGLSSFFCGLFVCLVTDKVAGALNVDSTDAESNSSTSGGEKSMYT